MQMFGTFFAPPGIFEQRWVPQTSQVPG